MPTDEELVIEPIERDANFYALLMEIRDLLVDIKRNTSRQISPS